MKKFIILLCMIVAVAIDINAMDAKQEELNQDFWLEIFSIDLSKYFTIFNADDCREKIKQLLNEGADVNSRNPFEQCEIGTIPLIYAISIFDVKLIELLIDSGVNINESDPFLRVNPIHRILDFLEFYDGENHEIKVIAYQVLDLLTIKGANLRIRNQEGIKAQERCKNFM